MDGTHSYNNYSSIFTEIEALKITMMNEMKNKEEMSLMPPNNFDFELFPPTQRMQVIPSARSNHKRSREWRFSPLFSISVRRVNRRFRLSFPFTDVDDDDARVILSSGHWSHKNSICVCSTDNNISSSRVSGSRRHVSGAITRLKLWKISHRDVGHISNSDVLLNRRVRLFSLGRIMNNANRQSWAFL